MSLEALRASRRLLGEPRRDGRETRVRRTAATPLGRPSSPPQVHNLDEFEQILRPLKENNLEISVEFEAVQTAEQLLGDTGAFLTGVDVDVKVAKRVRPATSAQAVLPLCKGLGRALGAPKGEVAKNVDVLIRNNSPLTVQLCCSDGDKGQLMSRVTIDPFGASIERATSREHWLVVFLQDLSLIHI